MSYQYRWLYVTAMCLMLIAAAYFFDIRDKFTRLAELQNREKQSKEKLVAETSLQGKKSNQATTVSSVADNDLTEIANFVNLAHMSGLSIKSIKIISRQPNNHVLIHLIAEGLFQQVYAFIFTLDRNKLAINYFSCHLVNQYQLQIEADIVLDKSIQYLFYQIPRMDNPFCSHNRNESLISPEMQFSSIKLMKMVGYLHQDERTQALILLPNKTLVAIHQGSHLGKEHAVVSNIQSNSVELTFNNKMHYLIKM